MVEKKALVFEKYVSFSREKKKKNSIEHFSITTSLYYLPLQSFDNTPHLNLFRSMTIFAESNVRVDVDLRMLRSFRVLRPLKLVSRIPSKKHERNVDVSIFGTAVYSQNRKKITEFRKRTTISQPLNSE